VLATIMKLAEGRLCSTMPMQRAVAAALRGDRSHQPAFRAALRERAEIVYRRANAIAGITSTRAVAAFYAMPKVTLPRGRTDAEFIVDLVHATGVLCVHGSGFGMDPADGYFRMVTLAAPSELNEIWDLIDAFVRHYK
jgi:aspartate/methionine/tyrosine aminotransferase